MLGFADTPDPAPQGEAPGVRAEDPAANHPAYGDFPPASNTAAVPAAVARSAEAALPATRDATALPSAVSPPEFQPPVESAHAPQEPVTSARADAAVAPGPRGIDEAALQRALEAALQSFVTREQGAEAAEAPEDLLSQSPVFQSSPRPVRRRGMDESAFR